MEFEMNNWVRQSGKTTELLRLLKKNKKAVMIVPTLMSKTHVVERDETLRHRIYAVAELGKLKRHVSLVLIDEPAIVFGMMLNTENIIGYGTW